MPYSITFFLLHVQDLSRNSADCIHIYMHILYIPISQSISIFVWYLFSYQSLQTSLFSECTWDRCWRASRRATGRRRGSGATRTRGSTSRPWSRQQQWDRKKKLPADHTNTSSKSRYILQSKILFCVSWPAHADYVLCLIFFLFTFRSSYWII